MTENRQEKEWRNIPYFKDLPYSESAFKEGRYFGIVESAINYNLPLPVNLGNCGRYAMKGIAHSNLKRFLDISWERFAAEFTCQQTYNLRSIEAISREFWDPEVAQIYETYFSKMKEVFSSINRPDDVALCWRGLGREDKYQELMSQAESFYQRGDRPLRVREETVEKCKEVLREYLDIFNKSPYANLDVPAYLADQKRQWRALMDPSDPRTQEVLEREASEEGKAV